MKAIIVTILCVLTFSVANANDSATPYIEVLGVNPEGNAVNSNVQVYGGETGEFFQALPETAPWYADDYRMIQFVSGSYIGSISCNKTYTRPTTGEFRDDHMCTFTIYSKTGDNDPDSDQYEGDSYVAVNDSFTSMTQTNLSVLGVWPQNVAVPASGSTKAIYSFYGKQAEVVAKRVIAKGGISMTSRSYKVSLGCQQYYVRPTTGKTRDDYKCSLSLKKN